MKYQDAKKHEELLRDRIKMAREKGDSRKAKRVLRQYLASHAAKIVAAYDMNANLRVHQRLSRTELQDVAASINVWRPEAEAVKVRREPKKSSGYRPISNFGPKSRARQMLVKNALEIIAELHPRQYAIRGGRNKACAAVRDRVKEGRTWAAELDVKSCFPSFDREGVRQMLPLPEKVVDYVVMAHHYNFVPTYSYGSIGVPEATRQGIPQGSIASSLVAEILLVPIAETVPESENVIMFADNILALGETKNEVDSIVKSLRCAFKSHLAGPLLPRVMGPVHTSDGFVFLGYKFRSHGSDVYISPTPENCEKFRSKIEWYLNAIEYSGWAADDIAAEARGYVGPWMASFSLANFAELLGYMALLEIEEAREIEETLASMGYPDFDPPLNSIANCSGSQL